MPEEDMDSEMVQKMMNDLKSPDFSIPNAALKDRVPKDFDPVDFTKGFNFNFD